MTNDFLKNLLPGFVKATASSRVSGLTAEPERPHLENLLGW